MLHDKLVTFGINSSIDFISQFRRIVIVSSADLIVPIGNIDELVVECSIRNRCATQPIGTNDTSQSILIALLIAMNGMQLCRICGPFRIKGALAAFDESV